MNKHNEQIKATPMINDGHDDQTTTIEDNGRQRDISEDAPRMLSACIQGVDVTEIYSPTRINQVCHEFGLRMGVIP